jgi:hypothetical protein
MPQGNYDARTSGNYKIVNGRRVPLPTRSSNDVRSGGERGPKGSRTYTREDTSSGQGMRDIYGVPFSNDPMGRPISSIARDVAERNKALSTLGNNIPLVMRPESIKAWYGDVTQHDKVHPAPTTRPWGREGKRTHPDYRAQTAREGINEAARASGKINREGRRQGFSNVELRQYTGPYDQVAAGLRADATRYEKEYADKYLSTQTQRMRDMMDRRKTPEQRGRENLAEVRNRNRREETNRLDRDIDFKPIPGRPQRFADITPPEIDLAPDDSHRGGSSSGLNSMPRSGNNGGPATASSVARDLGDYATRPLDKDIVYHDTKRLPGQHVSEAPPKSIGTQFKMAAPHVGRAVLGGLGVAAVAAADRGARREGAKEMAASNARASAAQQSQRRSDAADMGPVKGRALTQANAWAGGQPKQSGKGHSTGVKQVGK